MVASGLGLVSRPQEPSLAPAGHLPVSPKRHKMWVMAGRPASCPPLVVVKGVPPVQGGGAERLLVLRPSFQILVGRKVLGIGPQGQRGLVPMTHCLTGEQSWPL